MTEFYGFPHLPLANVRCRTLK